ncbi:hypothetical protein Tco_0587995 [Tanacetum coccineum]
MLFECKIVGQILLDHPLSYALTTTGDVPAVYLQQFWKTVSKVSNTKDTIRYKLDTQEIMYTIDMFCNTLKLPVETLKNPFIVPVNIWIIESFFNRVGYQGVVDKVSTLYTKFLAQPWQTMFKKKDYIQYPRFTKLIIVDLIKKYSSISSILREDYHSIKDDISLIRAIDDYKEYETVFVNIVVLMNQPQQVISTQGTHRSTPKAHRIPTLTFASPQGKKTKQSDDKDRDGMAETTLLSLTLHKTALAAEAKENIAKLTPAEAIQADCDIKAINIILQGLPTEIYALVSQHRVAKDLWEKIKLLMQGTSLTKQERECKLYDEFDKFTYKKGETLHEYYLRFTLLLNDMNIYKMPLEQFQVNTKFLNTLPDEWSKFVTDVKLVKDLHTTNVDQLHAHLQQHERHAIEVRLMHERNPDPLALVASHQLTQPAYQSHLHPYQHQHHVSPYQHSQFVTPYQHQHQQFSTNQSTPLSITYPTNEYQSTVHHNSYSQQPSIPQLEYAPTTYQQQQPEFSQPDSSLVVPVFQKGDDPIDAINHMMSLTAFVTSRYPTKNNHYDFVKPLNKATIYEESDCATGSGEYKLLICWNNNKFTLCIVVATRGNID